MTIVMYRVGYRFSLCRKILVKGKYFTLNSTIFDTPISNKIRSFDMKLIPLTEMAHFDKNTK